MTCDTALKYSGESVTKREMAPNGSVSAAITCPSTDGDFPSKLNGFKLKIKCDSKIVFLTIQLSPSMSQLCF